MCEKSRASDGQCIGLKCHPHNVPGGIALRFHLDLFINYILFGRENAGCYHRVPTQRMNQAFISLWVTSSNKPLFY